MKPLLIFIGSLALISCAKQERASFKDVVTQTTVRADKASLTPCSNLVQRGDFGVGLTGDGVMILETGVVYRVDAGGRAGRAPADATVSFALATFFETDRSYDIGDMDYKVFRNTLDWKRAAPGRIYAVRVSGSFSRITLGERPELHDVRGAMLGFFYPEYMRGLNDPGYDLYFLSADQASGGPVTDFTIKQGRIELDECTALLVDLPSTL